MDLRTTFCNIGLKNPIIAGSCDNSRTHSQFRRLIDSGVSAIVLKSLTDVESLQDRNIARFRCLNTDLGKWKSGEEIGAFFSRGGSMLNTEEWRKLIREKSPVAADNDVVLIGNICASSLENWKRYARLVEDEGIPAIELNLGNPHYGASERPMGARIAQSHETVSEIIETVSASVNIPVIAKLSPQVSDIVHLSRVAMDAGAAAVTIAHRFQGFMIDIYHQEPLSSHLYGYGGQWLLPIALGYVYKITKEVPAVICGSGGISRWEDVLQFILAGATTVQITSAIMLQGPEIVAPMLDMISEYCTECGIHRLNDIRGSAVNKTGYYDRIPHSARVKVLNKNTCAKCNDKPCIHSCFFDAILLSKDGSIEITDECTACGLCLQVCPFEGAIGIDDF